MVAIPEPKPKGPHARYWLSTTSKGEPRMSNPNQNPGQQTQNPNQKPGQQGGGQQKPGQQQQGGQRKPGQQQDPNR
jgi:hypothetical protein